MKDLSLHLMDIAQNSISAGADYIGLCLTATASPPELLFELMDNGRGMAPDFVSQVTDPFTTTRKTREVGLGIPLLKLSAELSGGSLTIASEQGRGTTIRAAFQIGNIDRIPIGDVAGTLMMLIMDKPDIDWELHFISPKDSFHLSTREIKEILNGVSLTETGVLNWIQNTVSEGIKSVFGGVLDEVT